MVLVRESHSLRLQVLVEFALHLSIHGYKFFRLISFNFRVSSFSAPFSPLNLLKFLCSASILVPPISTSSDLERRSSSFCACFVPMAAASEATTSICSHCGRDIPSSNIDLHSVHCARNLEKCKICGDMVPKRHAEEHFLNTHAPVSCSLCSETMERDILAIHKGENCPQRIATCEFCEFPLPAIDLAEHQEVCGNRTELCHLCRRYIRLREKYSHESNCMGVEATDNIAESSRDVGAAPEREQARDRGAQRRQPQEFSTRRLIFTIAITGIAVLLGSLFLPRKAENDVVVH